ncbi:PepSY-associated TM helix domain-containing protein [Acidomonas methanolica]|uniref:PepSY-associated TM helix domain-containing protein n=1 Tax=Acidomonas methanolica TaxID=437 RepID=UPI00211A61AE|nr:PepSY-associated TM helix domain-containing protein [Acidomonas methanolica]MCQ9154477.1 PepSY domain-containing protein [Acidomonas methanolica]
MTGYEHFRPEPPATRLMRPRRRIRPILLLMHRYVGLILAPILCLAGLTGSISVYRDEIDAALNPDLFTTTGRDRHLPLSTLLENARRDFPDAEIWALAYRPPPGHTIRGFLLPPRDGKAARSNDEFFLAPDDGRLIGARASEGCCLTRREAMPFIYRLHYALDLGITGTWILGIAAMVWTIDCVVGLALTFPLGKAPWRSEFWSKWKHIWTISISRGPVRALFDLHRAVSLWLWIVLLGMAVSGVALALGSQVFEPVVRTLLPSERSAAIAPGADCPTRIKSRPAIDAAEAQAECFVWRHGIHEPPAAVILDSSGKSATFYLFGPDGREPAGLGSPVVTVDLTSGLLSDETVPGHGRLGDLVLQMQDPWHSGRLAGTAGRIMICLSGIAVAILSVTGVMIWIRKRKFRTILRLK